MISLAQLLRHYQSALIEQYPLAQRHRWALQNIMDCHTPACGEMRFQCSDCHQYQQACHACGHRSCPACQHQANNLWLDRQRQKLLPVEYYMVTFTLPAQLRRFVWHHQRWAYQALFEAAVATLMLFGKNDKQLSANLGLTGVLHTHSRTLEFHPHVHFIVPNGGLSHNQRHWRQKNGKYLFNGNALGKVFRAKFIATMTQRGFYLPENTPPDWVAQCQHVGQGEAALTYLARYLYRGVINEKNILKHQDGQVTFQYQDARTKHWKTLTEPAVQFLWRVLQHVLPKGLRRTRDYGFLHGNAHRIRKRLQLILRVKPPRQTDLQRKKLVRLCPCCGHPMQVIAFVKARVKIKLRSSR